MIRFNAKFNAAIDVYAEIPNFTTIKLLSQKYLLTLRRPLRRKLRMRGFFDVCKVKESGFLKSDLTDPPSDF